MAPTIGITTYHTNADWRGWSEEGALLPWNYVTCVRKGGGRPVLLPPGGDSAEAEATVAVLDGVIIAGGADIDPAVYGAAKHPQTEANVLDRDAWELAVAEACVRQGVPLLGICRGAQMLNVACGGTLHQHVPDLVGHRPVVHPPRRGVLRGPDPPPPGGGPRRGRADGGRVGRRRHRRGHRVHHPRRIPRRRAVAPRAGHRPPALQRSGQGGRNALFGTDRFFAPTATSWGIKGAEQIQMSA
jgi:gamma-glutamyl-gamma-aminobutyrate hydrolase PuuD